MGEVFKEGTLARDALEMSFTALLLVTPLFLLFRLFWSNRQHIKANKPRFLSLVLLLIPTAFMYLAISSPFWLDWTRVSNHAALLLATRVMIIVVLLGSAVALFFKLNRRSTAILLSTLNMTLLLVLNLVLHQIMPREPSSAGRVIRLTPQDIENLKAAHQKAKK